MSISHIIFNIFLLSMHATNGQVLRSVSTKTQSSKGTITGPQGPQGPPEVCDWDSCIGVSGPTGATGSSGPSGPPGLQGPMGINGPSGPSGATSPSGPQGPQGVIGINGPSGPSGVTGASGPSGLQGPIGITGPSGLSGATGLTGSSGLQGPIGITGPSGLSGATGLTGSSGLQGPIGITGPSGPLGPTGALGATGPAGCNLYAFFYAQDRQLNPDGGPENNPTTIAPGGYVNFPSAFSSNSLLVPNDGKLFTLTQAGIYEIKFVVPVQGNGQLGVFIGGDYVENTVIGVKGSSLIVSISLISVSAGQILSIGNPDISGGPPNQGSVLIDQSSGNSPGRLPAVSQLVIRRIDC